MAPLRVDWLRDLQAGARARLFPDDPSLQTRIAIHLGTCGLAAGAAAVRDTLTRAVAEHPEAPVDVLMTGCAGLCSREPMVTVTLRGRAPVLYGDLDAEGAARIFAEHVLGGEVVDELALEEDHPFFQRQSPVALRNRGHVDPLRVETSLARGAYTALARVLRSMTPEEVVDVVSESGLRGRGGGGFPTGHKWRICREQGAGSRYVIANCDEGDPGAYMDRSLVESDPHAVLEGLAIAAYAVGASHGYLYIRSEYPLAVEHMEAAIAQAEGLGLLGESILGGEFSLSLEVRLGSGAFVCGEETSLIHSIEGRSPEPRQRPPYPVQEGIWGSPTVINNVETLASVPAILLRSAAWYADLGTPTSAGTKVFSLVGNVENTGLIEVPMGMTLREIVYDIGGGVPRGRQLKAVQTGGPSGGCLPHSLLELPLDYESLSKAGSMMGSGGMIVLDEDTCMVDLARFFVEFTHDESCGKCTTCREGSRALLEVLGRMVGGSGRAGDVAFLEELCEVIRDASMCGLGSSLPNPVLSTLRYFRDEYVAHTEQHECRALSCRALIRYHIAPERCVGCLVCLEACPVDAIRGERKAVHVIDQAVCTRCGHCLEVCPPKVAAVDALTGEAALSLSTPEAAVGV